MRRNIAVVVMLLGVLGLLASPTQARLRKSQTHVVPGSVQATVTGNEITRVDGAITTEKAKCLAGRTVEASSGPTQTLQSPFGTGTTDSQGRFSVTGSAPTDAFFAIQILKERRRNTVCKGTAHFGQLVAQ